ncbi:MAG: hypothetical protein HOH43_13380, partial [Candidatus Latescibacteria bacterium]|nr:hypothetical protein [Candidatus Latescibacterota bacterium]
MLQTVHIPKLIIAIVSAAYFLETASAPSHWRFLDGVDLIIHEAGHVILLPLGHFMHMIGGSLFQLLAPTAFVVHFHREENRYSAALILFWVGQNFLNISVYAGDAISMKLPLLGGADSIHDWNFLLITLGLLEYTP